jgi:hypothetical protein
LYIRAAITPQYTQNSVDLEPDRVLYIRATEAPQGPHFPSEHRDLYIRASRLDSPPPKAILQALFGHMFRVSRTVIGQIARVGRQPFFNLPIPATKVIRVLFKELLLGFLFAFVATGGGQTGLLEPCCPGIRTVSAVAIGASFLYFAHGGILPPQA